MEEATLRAEPGRRQISPLHGAHHVSFGGAPPGEITEAVKAGTLAFWDAYLKDLPATKASLKNGSVLDAWKQTARISGK